MADSLNTTGIYSLVRHPLYLGNFLMWLGVSLLTCHAGFILLFVLAYWLYYERIMFAEEQFLRCKFGKRYLTWANRTPAIIPDFKSFTPPRLPFSWKKVIKKEKNGIFALFLTFSLFDHLAAPGDPSRHGPHGTDRHQRHSLSGPEIYQETHLSAGRTGPITSLSVPDDNILL